MRKAQKKIAEENLQKAIQVTAMIAENAISNGKGYCICHVDVGLDVTAVREAVSKVMKDKVIGKLSLLFFFFGLMVFLFKLKTSLHVASIYDPSE